MSETIRVAQIGTGTLGSGVLKEVIRTPWIELDGLLVFTEGKDGRDAGEIAGMEAIDLEATRDFDEILALEVDAVLYCAMEIDDTGNDEPIIKLLESGKDVITSLAYHWTDARTEGLTERIEAACAKGGTTFHASGLNPGFIIERLTPLLTGMVNEIDHILVNEFFDVSRASQFLTRAMGLGTPEQEAKDAVYARQMADLYLRQSVYCVCDTLGIEIESLEREEEYAIAPERLSCDGLSIEAADGYTVEADTVGALVHRWHAVSGGRRFFTYEAHWYMTEAMKPVARETQDSWRIVIEGRPSVKVDIDVNASMATGELVYPGDPTTPGWYAIAAPMIQALPSLREAEPGIMPAASAGPHWTATRAPRTKA